MRGWKLEFFVSSPGQLPPISLLFYWKSPHCNLRTSLGVLTYYGAMNEDSTTMTSNLQAWLQDFFFLSLGVLSDTWGGWMVGHGGYEGPLKNNLGLYSTLEYQMKCCGGLTGAVSL